MTSRPPMTTRPAVIGFQPGDNAKQGRFSATRRADHDDELALLHREADATDRAECAVILGHVVDDEARHDLRLFAQPGEAADEVFLGEEEDGHDGGDRDRQAGHHRRPVRGELARQLEDADRNRLDGRIAQHQQR